jgi:hypothetical protein
MQEGYLKPVANRSAGPTEEKQKPSTSQKTQEMFPVVNARIPSTRLRKIFRFGRLNHFSYTQHT